MAKVQLDMPDDLHLLVRKLQIEEEIKGNRINLRDLYVELIKLAVAEKQKAAQK